MNLSKTSKYAIRVINYMATKKQELYSASFLVEELKISDKYLKRILTTLSNNSIIKSVQGRYGGFKLNKNINEINLYEIIKSVENIDKYLGCILGLDECSDKNQCSLHENWKPIQKDFILFLKNTTISEVMKNSNILKF